MLEKALILPEGAEPPIPVLFNPTQYSLEQGNQIAEVGVPGLGSPLLQYVRGNGRTLSMELFFDTYEQRSDVRFYTTRVYSLMDVRGTLRRPPVVTFAWGTFQFRCVVERVGGRFTLFLEDGTPVRATLSVSLREYVDVDVQVREQPAQTAGHARTYTVQRGDTLSGIAAAQYGDPGRWREIATANGISDPRAIQPGTPLSLPAPR